MTAPGCTEWPDETLCDNTASRVLSTWGGWGGGGIPGLGVGRIDSARDEWPSPLASGWRGGWGGGVEGVAVLMYLRAWAIMPALAQKGRPEKLYAVPNTRSSFYSE